MRDRVRGIENQFNRLRLLADVMEWLAVGIRKHSKRTQAVTLAFCAFDSAAGTSEELACS
ncbi:MAG: hypothetical protein EBZ78_02810 [Verrucomicrobia bacterium]|nr:hypothetical protein [Verrucomicrobiota bacterium]